MKIELIKVTKDHKPILGQLLEYYCYDFSEFIETDVNAHGYFNYRHLDLYFIESERLPFFIKVDNQYGGFVLINKEFQYFQDRNGYALAEFFVMRKYRRKGIGKQAAFKIFDQFTGFWEVSIVMLNSPALKFWSTIIEDYTQDNYSTTFGEKKGLKKQIFGFES